MSIKIQCGLWWVLVFWSVQACGVKVSSVCQEITCDGHGVCSPNDEQQPVCACDDGYVQQDNIHCIPETSETCGNEVIEDTEECDGEDVGEATCEGLGFYGGTLLCSTDCRFDTSQCTTTTCHTSIDCDDGFACTDDICNVETHICSHAYKAAGTVCREAVGVCDVAETCTGNSGECPVDTFQSNTHECRPAVGVCDVAETCTGSSALCPADTFQPNTYECRPAVGDCDVAETCTGNSGECPVDTFQPAGTVCDDGIFCTINDQCNDWGVCAGTLSSVLLNITSVAAGGGYHTCAQTTAEGVKCWGYNGYGQVGDNSTTNRLTPVNVSCNECIFVFSSDFFFIKPLRLR